VREETTRRRSTRQQAATEKEVVALESVAVRDGGTTQLSSRGLPSHPREKGPEVVIWVPPRIGARSKVLLECVFSLGPYFMSRGSSRGTAVVAFTTSASKNIYMFQLKQLHLQTKKMGNINN
jgi:hypothetical protein